MNKTEIIAQLKIGYAAFADHVEGLSDADLLFSLNGEKWNAAQQTDHLCLSVAPLNKGLAAPAFALKAMFGKADRPSRSYDELVAFYQDGLAKGGTAPSNFRPPEFTAEQKPELLSKLRYLTDKLCGLVDGFSEEKLDEIQLPHPLLGKLTLREMLYFTIYHAEHHLGHVRRNLTAAA